MDTEYGKERIKIIQIKKEIHILESGGMGKLMAMEYTPGQMVINMKDNGKII